MYSTLSYTWYSYITERSSVATSVYFVGEHGNQSSENVSNRKTQSYISNGTRYKILSDK